MEPKSFQVIWRNYGHWDINVITEVGAGRWFKIRGGPGRYFVVDERPRDERKDIVYFSTVNACMSYICDFLMYELIVAEGQTPQIIEKWNVK